MTLGSIQSIFRAPFLERIAHKTHYATLYELGAHFSPLCPPSAEMPLRDWFEFFYSLLAERYRCEYIYKNAITTKLFLSERHSLEESLLTSEFRIGKSRADVVILNGTSTVYEVKSDYDSLERLDSQIADYRRVFDRIFVVTSAEKAKSLLNRVDSLVGIIELSDDGELREIREARSNKDNTDPAFVFDCMRQAEFCSVIKDEFGYTPNVPNSKLYRESRKLFCKLDPDYAHDLMVAKVRSRTKKQPYIELIKGSPHSLKHACLSFSKSQALAVQIKEGLEEPLST